VINHFPTPLTDELFYSMCARYGDRVRYPGIEAVNKELFGARGMSAGIDLPSHLGHFAESLPPGHELIVQRVIDKHTLLPFYGPFLPVDRYARVREDMKSFDGSAIHKCAGITPSNVRLHDWLRYCPVCVTDDRRAPFRCCYWRRLHQVPGVMVCPQHEVFLENSTIRARNRINSALYVTAERANLLTNARLLDLNDEVHQGLLAVARNAAWLLDQPGLNPGYDLLNAHYLKLLSDKNLVRRGYIHVRELLSAMVTSVPRLLLVMLQCEFDTAKAHSWPALLVKNLRQGKSHHPLRHLLLMRLVGHTAESFFSSLSAKPHVGAIRPKPFGRSPWPCLNPVCADYGKSKIREIEVRESWKLNGVPVATVSCRCGFTYARRGPDATPEDRFRFDWIEKYGAAWEAALKRWWEDTFLSINRMAPLLGVAHNTVKYQAIRLGLKFPRAGPGTKVTRLNPIIQETVRRKQERQSSGVDAVLREAKREEWLEAMKQNPDANRTRLLREIAPPVYSWLLTNDKGWLKENMPPPFKRTKSAREIVDWTSRDLNLEKEVREAAERLKRTEGKPVQVTVTAIARELDKNELLQKEKHLAKLPLTRQALSNVAETRAQFALRRLRWATDCFRDEGLAPAKSTLALRAGAEYGIWKDEEMGAALEAEWRSLQELPSPNDYAHSRSRGSGP
jgi:Tn7-like transposition protein D/TniQ